MCIAKIFSSNHKFYKLVNNIVKVRNICEHIGIEIMVTNEHVFPNMCTLT